MELFDDRGVMIHCSAVTRRFVTPGGTVVALDEVDFEAHDGEFVVIAGPSGSGKSTLLAVLGAVDHADEGNVHVAGCDLSRLSRRGRRALRRSTVTVLLPLPSDNLFDRLDAGEHLRWAGRRATSGTDVIDVADEVGITPLLSRRTRELSGGEQQRLAVCMALAQGHRVLLADEPTASLDNQHAVAVIGALRTAADTGACVVVATHDRAVIDAADRVVWLANGRVTQEET
ncbi:MAG: hypothetical protein RJA49_2160 [Actinomycetota bacterium]